MRSVVHAGVRASLRVLAAEAALYDQPDEPHRSRGDRAVLRDAVREPLDADVDDGAPFGPAAHPADPACAAHLPRAEARASLDRPAGARLHIQQLVPRARAPCALPLHRRRQLLCAHLLRREDTQQVQCLLFHSGRLLVSLCFLNVNIEKTFIIMIHEYLSNVLFG